MRRRDQNYYHKFMFPSGALLPLKRYLSSFIQSVYRTDPNNAIVTTRNRYTQQCHCSILLERILSNLLWASVKKAIHSFVSGCTVSKVTFPYKRPNFTIALPVVAISVCSSFMNLILTLKWLQLKLLLCFISVCFNVN